MSTPLEKRRLQRFWNKTPFRSYLFNAFSLLLPSGEAFIIQAVESALASPSVSASLREAGAQFVREEKAHQRAHRTYNQQLATQGYNVRPLEARIESALQNFERQLTPPQRLCLAAAFEYLTALVSARALQGQSWLTADASEQSRLWRWHCQEELAHHRVALDLLAVSGVGYSNRVATYLGASVILLGDIVRHILDFYRSDRTSGTLKPASFWRSVAGFMWDARWGLLQLSMGWLKYLLPLPASTGCKAPTDVEVRFLQPSDIPQLLVLEGKKWDHEQAAQATDLAQRMAVQPRLCVGAFSRTTGEALASLFLKPVHPEQLQTASTWADCAKVHGTRGHEGARDLFGISLSSVDASAVEAIFEFFWPHALKAGWRHIYLGSPVPGLAQWYCKNPGQPVENYVYATRKGQPKDPQLRYYWAKGFKKIIACKSNYFPHAASLNHGVLIRGRIPLSALAPLWKQLPLPWLHGLKRLLFVIV